MRLSETNLNNRWKEIHMGDDKKTQCIVPRCRNESYFGDSKCILHCEKDESMGFASTSQFSDFFDALIDDVVEQAFRHNAQGGFIQKESLESYLNNRHKQSDIVAFAKTLNVRFVQFVFPERDEKYPFDYLQVLNKLGGIHFDNCKFSALGLDIKGAKCFFQECNFLKNWIIYDLHVLANVNNVLYQQCTFEQDVNVCSETDERCAITNPLFYNCKFLGNVQFERVDFKKPLFNNKGPVRVTLKQFELTNCTFSDRFILNNCDMEVFSVADTVFSFKFEFKTNKVADFRLSNTNFLEIADFYGSYFEHFLMERNIFKDFVGFEDCEFGITDGYDSSFVATFEYVTFSSFANFRNATFNGGLDIAFINLKEPPNFLKAFVPLDFTNRETLRIIKHSFEKIGNNIEANKYFVLEMKKYKQELFFTKGKRQEKIVFWLNEHISNFGQNYFRPMWLILFFGIIYTVLVYGLEQNALYKIHPSANQSLSMVTYVLNYFATNFLPYSKFLKEGMEFISLLFYIVFLTLIWQTVISIKRHVRR